jgi:beta-lactamase regulating signal transducer with metallopeptidase domain
LPGLWAAGVLVGLLRLALGLGSLQLTARRAAPGTEKLRRELEQGSTRWAPGSRVALREGTPGEMPLTWGILRHIISLPPEAAAWPASRRRTVFRHELAHVQRRDFLWLTLARLAVLPVWWHPLAWWVVRELARTAEHAADDHATGTGTGADRAAYAGDLVTIVSSCHRNRTGGGLLAPLRIGLGLGLGLALAMAMGRPRPTVLRRRVEALLEPVRDRAAFGPRGRTALALATTLLMVGLAGLAACRPQSAEEPAPEQSASKEPSVPQPPVMETRIYELGTHQRAVLLATLVPAKSRPAVDPFGGGQPAPPPTDKEKTDRLALCATLVREHLFGTGRVSYPKHARPEVTMESERAMSLTAAPATHAEVSAYLARYDSGPQVLLRTYMMEVDVGWAPWAQAGLQTPTGQMQVNGVLTPAEGRLLLEALNKDPRAQATISMPAIITRSGRPSRMDMVREFIYPTEFDPAHFTPPGTPKSPVGSSPGPVVNASLGDTDGTFTPTTPTAFEMRPIGRQLEVNALVLPDGRHQLDLTWEITEFMGFMNYGQPIKKTSTGTDGKRHEITVSENRIEQPIFQSMKVSTSAVVEPGHYLVMGGIKPERSATLEGMSEALHRPPGRVADAPSDKGRPVMYVLILQSNLMELPAAIPVPVPGTPTTPSPATGKE